MNLVDSGFPLEIITAREGKEFDFAQKWLKQNGIYIPVKSTLDGEDKTKACNGLDVYVEDIPYQANSLKEVVPLSLIGDHEDFCSSLYIYLYLNCHNVSN